MKFISIATALLIGLIATGCVTTSNLQPGTSESVNANEAIIVLGVNPRYRVALANGTPNGENWSRDHGSVATTNTYPEDGYIVVKVPARAGAESYGVAQILPEGIGGFAPQYLPCNGQNLVTFEAPGGKVTYVGDIEMTLLDRKVGLYYSRNVDQARGHLSRKYPSLASKLEDAEAKLLTMNNTSCGPVTITVPIFIRGR